MLNIREAEFSAISYGNEELQKVIVLVLSKYEDGEDFKEILTQLNQTVMDFQEPDELAVELKRIFELSQSVFRAREAVMLKLAQDITDMKNREIDMKNALKYLFEHEHSDKTRIIYALMINGSMNKEDLAEFLQLPEINIQLLTQDMISEGIIDQQEDFFNLLITYGELT
jgi:hypothetical protein